MTIISVFGSTKPKQNTHDYETARHVGELIAKAGFTVQTGGYSGVMEAVSRGANEAGGHVIGITSNQIEIYRPIEVNQWVVEETKYSTLQERLIHLVTRCDAAIAMPGGIGTLTELSLVWNFMQVGEIPLCPLIAVGKLWQRTLSDFLRTDYVIPKDVNLIQFADTPKTAIDLLKSSL